MTHWRVIPATITSIDLCGSRHPEYVKILPLSKIPFKSNQFRPLLASTLGLLLIATLKLSNRHHWATYDLAKIRDNRKNRDSRKNRDNRVPTRPQDNRTHEIEPEDLYHELLRRWMHRVYGVIYGLVIFGLCSEGGGRWSGSPGNTPSGDIARAQGVVGIRRRLADRRSDPVEARCSGVVVRPPVGVKTNATTHERSGEAPPPEARKSIPLIDGGVRQRGGFAIDVPPGKIHQPPCRLSGSYLRILWRRWCVWLEVWSRLRSRFRWKFSRLWVLFSENLLMGLLKLIGYVGLLDAIYFYVYYCIFERN